MDKKWNQKAIKALQLNGKGERTQQSYVRAVRVLSDFYECYFRLKVDPPSAGNLTHQIGNYFY